MKPTSWATDAAHGTAATPAAAAATEANCLRLVPPLLAMATRGPGSYTHPALKLRRTMGQNRWMIHVNPSILQDTQSAPLTFEFCNLWNFVLAQIPNPAATCGIRFNFDLHHIDQKLLCSKNKSTKSWVYSSICLKIWIRLHRFWLKRGGFVFCILSQILLMTSNHFTYHQDFWMRMSTDDAYAQALAKSMVLDMFCKHFMHMLACAGLSPWRHRLSAIACTPHVCPLHARSSQSWSMQKSYAEAQPDCPVLQNPAHLAGKAFVPLVWQYNMAMAVQLSLSLSCLGIHPGPPGLLYYTNKVYVTVSWKRTSGTWINVNLKKPPSVLKVIRTNKVCPKLPSTVLSNPVSFIEFICLTPLNLWHEDHQGIHLGGPKHIWKKKICGCHFLKSRTRMWHELSHYDTYFRTELIHEHANPGTTPITSK